MEGVLFDGLDTFSLGGGGAGRLGGGVPYLVVVVVAALRLVGVLLVRESMTWIC